MTANDLQFLNELEVVINDRIENPSPDSYTSQLVESGMQRIAQKVGEESVELVLAATGGERQDIVSEAADLVYHLLVLLRKKEISLGDVASELSARHQA